MNYDDLRYGLSKKRYCMQLIKLGMNLPMYLKMFMIILRFKSVSIVSVREAIRDAIAFEMRADPKYF